MSQHDDIISQLADLVGIADAYRDLRGEVVRTPLGSKLAILEGLGLEIATGAQAREALARVRALKNGLVPSLISAEAGRPVNLALRHVTRAAVVWRLQDEAGAARLRHGRLDRCDRRQHMQGAERKPDAEAAQGTA